MSGFSEVVGGAGANVVIGGIPYFYTAGSYTYSATQIFNAGILFGEGSATVATGQMAIYKETSSVNMDIQNGDTTGTLFLKDSAATNHAQIKLESSPIGSSSAYNNFMFNGITLTYVTTAQSGDFTNMSIGAVTVANPSAGTITNAATMKISGAPIAGTNTTLTNSVSLWVAGSAGTLQFASNGRSVLGNTAISQGDANATLSIRSATLTPTGSSSAYNAYIFNPSETIAFGTTAQSGDFCIFKLNGATLTNPSAGTITNAATLKIVNTSIASTNVTITNNYSLWVAAGITELDGVTNMTSTVNIGTAKTVFNSSGLITKYNNVTTAGFGVPVVVASYSTEGNSALVSNAINYTPPAAAGTYRISVFINVVTPNALGSMAATLTYDDAGGGEQSYAMQLHQQGSITSVNNLGNTTAVFSGEQIFQIDNSADAITLSTTGTTETDYDMAIILEQLA